MPWSYICQGAFYVQKVCEPACQQLPIRPSLRVHTFCDWCFFLMVIILNVHTVLRFISQMCCIYKKNCGKWHFIFHDQEIQYTLQHYQWPPLAFKWFFKQTAESYPTISITKRQLQLDVNLTCEYLSWLLQWLFHNIVACFALLFRRE